MDRIEVVENKLEIRRDLMISVIQEMKRVRGERKSMTASQFNTLINDGQGFLVEENKEEI
jgi:hypothetical protein